MQQIIGDKTNKFLQSLQNIMIERSNGEKRSNLYVSLYIFALLQLMQFLINFFEVGCPGRHRSDIQPAWLSQNRNHKLYWPDLVGLLGPAGEAGRVYVFVPHPLWKVLLEAPVLGIYS